MGVRHVVVDSPVGPLTLVADGVALIGLYFDGHLRPPRLADRGPRVDDGFDAAVGQLASTSRARGASSTSSSRRAARRSRKRSGRC
jgi:hypothetical protein